MAAWMGPEDGEEGVGGGGVLACRVGGYGYSVGLGMNGGGGGGGREAG